MKRGLIKLYNRLYDIKIMINEYIYRNILEKPNIMSREDTLNYIIANNVSVSRIGDGELKLIDGESIGFQRADPILAVRMKEILKSDDDKCLVCLTNIWGNLQHLDEKAKKYYTFTLANKRKLWYSYIDMEKKYGSADITRFYNGIQDVKNAENYVPKLKTLWEAKDILIVEGNQSRMGVGNDLFDNTKSIRRILCPTLNAFSIYETILQAVKKYAKKEDVIIVALGPTATVLSYDLAQEGYKAWDLGHMDIVYEWYVRRAVEKVKIEGKYVNETMDGRVFSECNNEKYRREIILELCGEFGES